MRGGTRAWASFLTWPFPPGKLRRLPTRGPRPHGRHGSQETSRLIPSAQSGTKAGGGGGRTTIRALREEKVSEEPAERRRSAKLGETAETLRGEEARESGFPLNCARHSGSLRQVSGPGLCVPFGSRDLRGPQRPLGAPPWPRRSRRRWPLPQARLARRLPLTASGRGQRPRRQ